MEEGSDLWGPAVVGVALLSWVGCCVGSCLGMGYVGPAIAAVALGLALEGLRRPHTDKRLIAAGLLLALANIVLFVLLIGSLVLGFLGLLAAEAAA